MESFIAPLLLLVVLFIGFGMTHRRGQGPASCSGCTDEECPGKAECSNEGKAHHH